MYYRNTFSFIKIFLAITFLMSCSSPRSDNSPDDNKIPQALEDKSIEIRSYGRSGSLLEELYQELVDNTPALQRIEEELKAIRPKVFEGNDKFTEYDNKSINYYGAAKYKAEAINDSLLRLKMVTLIKNRSLRYTNKKSELESLMKEIADNSISLNDHHAVLKIVLTLPIIEKYQTDNRPDEKVFKDIIKEQENLILSIDSLDGK